MISRGLKWVKRKREAAIEARSNLVNLSNPLGPSPSAIPGIEQARRYLGKEKNAFEAHQKTLKDRGMQPWDATTPQGAAARNAENYAWAYYAVSNAQFGSVGFTWIAYISIGVPGWQAVHGVRTAGINAASKFGFDGKDADPNSLDGMAAGYLGAMDAYLDSIRGGGPGSNVNANK